MKQCTRYIFCLYFLHVKIVIGEFSESTNESKGVSEESRGISGEFSDSMEKDSPIKKLYGDDYMESKTATDNTFITNNNAEKDVDELSENVDVVDMTELFGSNAHYSVPLTFDDLGRRRLIPISKGKSQTNRDAENKFHNSVKKYLDGKEFHDGPTPVKALPEFVIAVAKQSALLEASKPRNPSEDIINKDILRTGNYWDTVWQEDVDVKNMLRSKKHKKKLSVNIKIEPGSNLYTLVSALIKVSPELLYVINNKTGGRPAEISSRR